MQAAECVRFVVRDKFAEWVTKTQSPKTASDIVWALTEADAFLLSQHLSSKSVYELSCKKAVSLLTALRGNRAFRNKTAASMQVLQRATTLLNAFFKEYEEEITNSAVDNLVEILVKTPHKSEAASSSETKMPVPATDVAELESSVNTPEHGLRSNDVLELIRSKNIPFVDNRQVNGALWIIGGAELQPFVDMCARSGFTFTYKSDGSRSSQGQPCWRCSTSGSNHGETSTRQNETSFDAMLEGELYRPLHNALVKNGITTIETLRSINLWAFMNTHSLYTIQNRLKISTELTNLINLAKAPEADAPVCKISFQGHLYTGTTPSEAFVSFLSYVATKYPLKFRGLIGVVHSDAFKVVIRRHNYDGSKLKLMNPEAYVDKDLTVDQVRLYVTWVLRKCAATNRSFEIEVTEPAPMPDPAPVAEIPKLPEPSKDVQPDTSKPCVSVYQPKGFPSPAPRLVQQAEKYLLQADLAGATYDQLQAHLHTTMVATKEAVSQSPHIVEMNRQLYHQDAFVDFEEGSEAIADIIDKLLKKNGGLASATQLCEYVRSEMAMFLNDNDISEQQAIYDLARHLFEKVDYQGKHHCFKSNFYISIPEVAVDSYIGIIQKFAREKGSTFTFSEIETFLSKLGLNTGNLRGRMKICEEAIFLIYQENEYLLAESVGIDDAFLDRMQNAFVLLFSDVGDHVILRNISESWYSLLPPLPSGLGWTPMLLQQLLHFYTKPLGARTIIAMESQGSNTLHAMLVTNNSGIQDFRDVVAVYLHEELPNRDHFEAEELRQLLVLSGMISGNELIWNMPKALSGDPRFVWDSDGQNVYVRL